MTRPNQKRRSSRLWWLWVLVLSLSVPARPVSAKEILKGVEPSENRVYIRTDGLACYFCAYGLERFFKKTGRIAAFDLDTQEGIVEAIFVQGEPLIAPETLTSFVHDAGFAPRWIDAELVGSLEVTSAGEASMRIRETDERVSLEDNDTLREFLADEEQVPTVVRIRGRVEDDEGFAMRLAPEWIREEASS